MAKIQTENIVVKLSKLVKNSDDELHPLVNEDFDSSLEAIVQELVGETVLVEIERGE